MSSTHRSGELQHVRALRLANEVRCARARLKRRLAAGEVGAAQVIARPPAEAQGMTLAELLASQRRWGDHRTRRLLRRVGLQEQRRLSQLTERQRQLLTAALSA